MLIVPRFYHIQLYTEDRAKIVTASGHLEVKNLFAQGLRPGPRWGSLQLSPEPLAGGEVARSPSQEPHPASAFWASTYLLLSPG